MTNALSMERLFRRHFWAVNLLFILLVAYLAARTVNVFVESKVAPLPTGQSAARSLARARPASEPPSRLNIDAVAKVTGLRVPAEQPAVVETAPHLDPNAAPVRSGLRAKLLGTLLAGHPEWSLATIQDMNTQRSNTYMVGDRLMGAEVLEIERMRVIINNNGRREFIDAQGGTGEMVAVSPMPQPMPTPGGGPTGGGIRAIDENNYEVPRAEIDRTLSNLNEVAMQARIVPAFKDGVAQGFKLFSIRPDSIYSRIGVVNGDVIRRINGFDLNSPEKALEVYSKLKEANRIDLEIERNGAVLRKTYNIR